MINTKYLKHSATLALCFFVALASCRQNPTNSTSSIAETTGTSIADTIIYPVLIKNANPNDSWTEHCLSRLEREKFTDQLFEAVYSEKATAYSYNTHEPLTLTEVRNIEQQAEFTRDKVAKLQFWETWRFDEQSLRMTKKVHAILLAYEIFTEEGELRGYKAAFYVKLPH
ncbi:MULTISPECIES: hypothetical protein [unclassified Carboxylicivirga]|uniref:hypothetical protein n=1 Tax=Carboxylicivirga TaxID=1628153 RepID=UPI003D34D28F